jgi:CelD/BcsL family acetyltransferase involved in cellulose biosynthesis
LPSIVTANNLRTGAVVYLGPAGCWTANLNEAAVAADAVALKALEAQALAAVEATEVTAVYAMDVRVVDGVSEPTSVRERIRAAHAPTV